MKKIFLSLLTLSAMTYAGQLHAFSAEYEKYGDIKFINPSEDSKAIKEFKYGENVRIEWENIISDTSWQYSLINKETGKTVYWGEIETGETTLDFILFQDPGTYYFNFNGKAAGDDSPVFKVTSEKFVSIEKVSVTTEEPVNIAAYFTNLDWNLSAKADFAIWATCSKSINISLNLDPYTSYPCGSGEQNIYRGNDITEGHTSFKVWSEDEDIVIRYELYAKQDGAVIDTVVKEVTYKPRKISYPDYDGSVVTKKPEVQVETKINITTKENGIENKKTDIVPNEKESIVKMDEIEMSEENKVLEKAVDFFDKKEDTVIKHIEVGGENSIYQVTGIKEVKLFGIFKKEMKIETKVDGNTGEFLKVKKPWWSFLAF